MHVVKPALGLTWGQNCSCGLSILLGGMEMICPARHFGCLRGGAFRSLAKGGIPFHYLLSSFV